ncbi:MULTISPECIES: TspO/MBR family protein [Citricoccus]|uniref:TspO/MBR family protein n=1 Tax=Citricoccus TaxID=169133 RepID=UPI000255EF70|nr:TspO/MBR family protein [Citricoccus sp. CH26A]
MARTNASTTLFGVSPGQAERRRRARRRRTAVRVGAAVGACAVVGSLLTDPTSRWYRSLRKPSWQPPPAAFPLVWTALYADIAWVSSRTISAAQEDGRSAEARSYARALGVNLALNAAWSGLFFRARQPALSAVGAGALALSAADLARRAGRSRALRGWALVPYVAWTTLATALCVEIARLNPQK